MDLSIYTARDYLGMLFFLILLLLVVSFPIQLKGVHVFFVQPITLAILLQFGLIIEVILTQVAILFFLIREGIKEWEKYFLNLSMFLFTSFGSASIYFLLGGNIQPFSTLNPDISILPIVGYIVSSIIINHLVRSFMLTYFYRLSPAFFSKIILWEALPLLLVSPSGILIYILYKHLHIFTIFYVLVPVLVFLIIFRLYRNIDDVNEKLKTINETGSVIGRQLDQRHVVDSFVKAISKLVAFEYCSIVILNEARDRYRPLFLYSPDMTWEEKRRLLKQEFNTSRGIAYQMIKNVQTMIMGKERLTLPMNIESEFTRSLSSILVVPLIQNGQVIGILTLGHREKKRYSQRETALVEMVANQAANALKNVRKYESAKRQSEIDELTGLFNYRYFEHEIFQQLSLAKEQGGNVSLILLDIDYFKNVNDTYGHSAGNQLLQSLATLLMAEARENEVVARYGGEEFTILLKDTGDQQAYHRAEQIRRRIEETVFEIEADLAKELTQEKKLVTVTVSMGLASYPVHAEDAVSLIRHADRAMYVGAKRKGRNKVAVYNAVV